MKMIHCPPTVSALRFVSLLLAVGTLAGLARADAPYNTPITTAKASAEVVLGAATGSDLAQFPGLVSIDRVVSGAARKRVLAYWDVHPDVPGVTPPPREGKRDDGPLTFPFTYSAFDNGVIRLRDGRLLGVDFTSRMLPLGAATGTSQEIDTYISSNEGLTFAKTTGTLTTSLMKSVNAGSGRGGFVFHRSLWQANDGTIYGTFYGNYNTDTTWRVLWCKTTNFGVTWTVFSTIATGNMNETAVAECADGSLLAIMRGPEPYLYHSRSTNGGTTWSTKALLTVAGASPVAGVSPELKLLTNGVLLLASGRPNDWVAISTDNGVTWTNKTNLYLGAGYAQTSGYQAIAEMEGNMALVAYDTGATAGSVPSPNPYSIRYKEVTAMKGPVQRIDLKTKAELGLISVTTNMTYSDPNLPPLRPHGAFDGSSYYWAAAFKDGSLTDGYYIINLDKPYTITNLGVLLKRGYPESASVSFSTDGGATWGSPVKTYTNATHYALDYTNFATPHANVNAVRVTTVGQWTGLNEIELYTNHDTFENESDFNVPNYWTNVNGFGCVIESAVGYQSNRALRVHDYLTTGNPLIQKISTNSAAKNISFHVYPSVLPNGFIFSVKANVSSGVDTAFHFSVTSSGALQWYNGTAWATLGGAGTVPVGSWSLVQINATLSSAAIRINGVSKGIAGIYAQAGKTISSLKGLAFGGYGTAPSGDSVYFDDVDLP